MFRFSLVILVVALAAPSHAERGDDVVATVEDQLSSVSKADELIRARLDMRRADLDRRVRALYKLSRGGFNRMWVDPAERAAAVKRRGAAARIVARDIAEVAALSDEKRRAEQARVRLSDSRRRAARFVRPARGSLTRPVGGKVVGAFGDFKHDQTTATLRRRGIDLSATPGERVHALADGEVIFAGSVKGIGGATIVEHQDGLISLVGRLDVIVVRTGQNILAGELLGNAASDAVYVEVRLPIGPGGHPLDPAPLLARAER